MKIRITGDLRQIAESAWISSISEIKAKARSDDDARRVVKFLVENHHTSPLESVTLSFDFSKEEAAEFEYYLKDKYIRYRQNADDYRATIDLLNFLKVTFNNDLFSKKPWSMFGELHPELAKICEGFRSLGDKKLTPDADLLLGSNGMKVDLINFHDEGDYFLSRATWRIVCPLSISLQLVRHRSGSPNQASGRYKTLNQAFINPVKDCQELFSRMGLNLEDYLNLTQPLFERYREVMKLSQQARDKDKVITNQEYKRIREFARFILPEGRLTELYMTFYLDDFYYNYLPLRDSEDAQIEHIWIAQKMEKTLREVQGEK